MRIAAIALLGSLFPALALAVSPEGLWEGAILYKPAEMETEIVVEMARDAKGKLVGTIDIPYQDIKLIPLEEVTAAGSSVSFVFSRFSQRANMEVRSPFKGTLSEDGRTIRGDFIEGGKNTHSFVLERKGAPGAERTQPEARAVLPLSDAGAELKEAFNREVDKVRLVYLISPTCPVCMQNSRLTQRYIMDRIGDDRLKVFVVWGPMQKKETEADARAATTHLTDPRVTHFWTDDHVLAEAYKKPLGLEKDYEPAWDIYMLFPPGARWSEALPVPSYFMWVEKKLPAETRFNAEKLGEQVQRLLAP